MEETVYLYRSPDYASTSRIGRGTVGRTPEIAVSGSGSILRLHVKDGDTVSRGDLLFETVTGTLDGLFATGNEIVSDVSGVIATVNTSAGANVNKGDALLTVYTMDTLQVEIIRWEQPEIPRVWFVSDIRFKPEAESIHPQAYINATFPGQMIYPETLAQTAQLVFGINGDYYIYREDKHATGNIIRNRQVLYNHTKTMSFPNMDTMALRDDGSMSVYDVQEITADELLAQGDVHDALSFGPWLVRDGRLRVWDGKNSEAVEPRNAIGMVEPGHYKVITVEGRFNKGVGPAGVTLNMLAQMLYAQGVQQGFNLDGGNTAVLIFMGKKLNRTASKSGNGETQPRNMSELFGIGSSGLVHTDKLDVH